MNLWMSHDEVHSRITFAAWPSLVFWVFLVGFVARFQNPQSNLVSFLETESPIDQLVINGYLLNRAKKPSYYFKVNSPIVM